MYNQLRAEIPGMRSTTTVSPAELLNDISGSGRAAREQR